MFFVFYLYRQRKLFLKLVHPKETFCWSITLTNTGSLEKTLITIENFSRSLGLSINSPKKRFEKVRLSYTQSLTIDLSFKSPTELPGNQKIL
jgi:hypothetical protein